MEGNAHIVTMLLFSFIHAGVGGQVSLTSVDGVYDISYPCGENIVCVHTWRFGRIRNLFIAIISNGEVQKLQSDGENCNEPIPDLTTKHVGQHLCQRVSGDNFESYTSAPKLKLLPLEPVSLQCVLLSSLENINCLNRLTRTVSLTWVDDAGEEIQDNSTHQITRRSSCDITLTLTYQHPGTMRFRCRATVGTQTMTSTGLWVRAPGLKGKGRVVIVDPETQGAGQGQAWIGPVVGVVGGVVSTAAVGAFLLHRRRSRGTTTQLHEVSDQSSGKDVPTTDGVIYADIIHPWGSDSPWVHGCNSTEYACVR